MRGPSFDRLHRRHFIIAEPWQSRDLSPGNGAVPCNLLVYQILDIAQLLRSECCTREIERQLLRADKASLLHRIGRNDLVQRPMEQMRNGVMPLYGIAPRCVNGNT